MFWGFREEDNFLLPSRTFSVAWLGINRLKQYFYFLKNHLKIHRKLEHICQAVELFALLIKNSSKLNFQSISI